jgi:hypothetical protein
MVLKGRRRIIAVMLTAAVAFCFSILTVGSASAAQSTKPAAGTAYPSIATYQKVFTASPMATAGRHEAVRPQVTPSCTLFVTFPGIVSPGQQFGPFNPFYTAVGGVAWVTCNVVVPQITVAAALSWDGALDIVGPPVTNQGTSASANAFSVDVCTSGDWAVGVDAVITWPAGWGPPTTGGGFGPSLYFDPVTCGT